MEDDAGKYYLHGDDARCYEILTWDIQKLSETGEKHLELGDTDGAQEWFAKMNAISQLKDKTYVRDAITKKK